MRKVILMLMMLGLFGAMTPVMSQELPSCDELAEMADALDDVRDAFDELKVIEEDGEIDQLLGDIVTALEDVAKIERDQKLTRAVKSLARAWDDMDSETFGLALDSVVTNFDRLYRNECE